MDTRDMETGQTDAHGGPILRHSALGRKGDLTVELHYGDFDTGHGREAALYLHRRGHSSKGVYIPLSMMWQFGSTTNDQAAAMMQIVPGLTEQLYGVVLRDDMTRVMDAVLDYLTDLQASPPDPKQFEDRSLDALLQQAESDGLQLQVRINGDRVIN